MKGYLAYCQNRRMQVKPAYLGFAPRALIAMANSGNLEKKVEREIWVLNPYREEKNTEKQGDKP
jgi:hypothetical protein